MDTIVYPIAVAPLAARMGSAQQPLILDVRREPAFGADSVMIAGATWRDPFSVGDWLKYLPTQRDNVVYCVHGHEISKNVCAALRSGNIQAFFLDGGIEAWKTQNGMTINKNAACPVPSALHAPSRWITRERPKIDRIACPWLIRRFIDPLAEFLYVPAASVIRDAASLIAIPYDVPGVTFTHRGDNAGRCTFDALIEDFGLKDASLDELATIVRGADNGHPELTPQSPGLLAVSMGLSALYKNDLEMLAQGMIVYDALYAWLKSVRSEVHNADLFKAQA